MVRLGLAVAAVLIAWPGSAGAVTFSNQAPIAPGEGLAQGESPIAVSGQTGPVSKVSVTLAGLTHNTPDDLDILLVAPGGENSIVLSDTCGGAPLANVTLSFDDEGSAAPSNCFDFAIYKPTNVDATEAFAPPAPTPPYSVTFSSFVGTDPNGTWTLFVRDDDIDGNTPNVANGWTLDLTLPPPPATPLSATTPPPVTVPAVGRKKCKKGRKLVKRNGIRRCVKKKRRK